MPSSPNLKKLQESGIQKEFAAKPNAKAIADAIALHMSGNPPTQQKEYDNPMPDAEDAAEYGEQLTKAQHQCPQCGYGMEPKP